MTRTVANYRRIVNCVRVVTASGITFRFAAYKHDLTMSNGAVYKSNQGYAPTQIVIESTATSSVWDLSGFFDAAGIDRDQVVSNLMDNARVYYFSTDWANPVEDEQKNDLGIMGKAEMADGRYTIQVMDLMDTTTQSVGSTTSPLCPYTVFDANLDGDVIPYSRSRCSGPRDNPDGPLIDDYKVSGTVTSVTSQSVWADSGRTEDAGYFSRGSVLWKTGDNAGLPSRPIKNHEAGGVFTHYEATHYPIQVGDTYDMIPGCDQRKSGDCKNKYNNVINNGGFEDSAPPDAYKEFGGQ